MSEPQNSSSLPGSSSPTSSLPKQYERPSGRSIMMTETLKFEIDHDDPEVENQIRKQLGLDNRYPIGPSGRPVAGSKRAAKSLDKAYGAPMKVEQNEASPDVKSEGRVKVPWGVNPPESFSFGTLTGNGDADMKDATTSNK